MNRRGRAFRRTNATSGNPNMRVLLAAPSLYLAYDADYQVTKDGSNLVTNLISRVGGHTIAATGAQRPTWGASSPTGRRGITFASASANRLVDPLTVVAAQLDGTQAYSALWGARFTTPTDGTQQILWGLGNSGNTADAIQEGIDATSGNDRRARGSVALGLAAHAGNAHSTTIVTGSTVYTAATVSSWINGTASIVAAANVREPSCDMFLIGARRLSGAYAAHFNGEFFWLSIALGAWTTAQRQAQEAALKAYLGTP